VDFVGSNVTILVKSRCWIEDGYPGHVCGVDWMLISCVTPLFPMIPFFPCDKR